MKKLPVIFASLFALLLLAGVTGCEDQTSAEDVGESIDDAATEMRNAAEDACEDMKEGMNADNTNC